jgi:type II secretory pathway component PulF
MEWYYIVLIVIGYIIMMILTAYLLNKYTKGYDDMGKEECILTGMFWPFVLCFFIFYIPISGIMWVIMAIAEKWDSWEKKSKTEE